MKFLVIDDSSYQRVVIGDILKEMGHEVIGEANNGKDGFDLINELSPDAVTLDFMMPGTNGLELLKSIQNIPQSPKIVMVTGVAQDAVKAEAQELGVAEFVTKPIAKDNLQGAIKRL